MIPNYIFFIKASFITDCSYCVFVKFVTVGKSIKETKTTSSLYSY